MRILVAAAAVLASVAAHADGLNDPQLVGVAVTANNGEQAEGALAYTRASQPETRFFAGKMIVDHRSATASLANLDDFLGFSPASSDLARQLYADGQRSLAELSSVPAAQFDCAYLSHEVDEHAQALQLYDDVLIPQAQDHRLLRLQLIRDRALVVEHLAIAQSFADRLGCD